MKAVVAPVPTPLESDGQITIHNRLHPGHRYRAAMDEIFRVALSDLPGPWDVSVYAVGRPWVRIDIVAPDGSRWSLSVPVQGGHGAEGLTGMVRAACVRYSRLRPAGANSEEEGGQ